MSLRRAVRSLLYLVELVIKSMELKQMLYPEMGYLLELQIVGKISVRISMLCCSLQNP